MYCIYTKILVFLYVPADSIEFHISQHPRTLPRACAGLLISNTHRPVPLDNRLRIKGVLSSVFLSLSTMSASSGLPRFFVYAPDKTDSGAFERRLSVRAKHFENATKAINDGTIRVGGVLLTPESLTSADKKMVGSMMIFEAENLDAVRTMIETDIYYTSGVWDPERLVILPFVAATPFP
ncbi:hypothetical protein B0H10DRAFT_2037227 [Mycena sp. CBHHK59/15]|nr:hypothetical protein B0H10DRAFT_2037227 [Mycena sp. CBHHK59/15]